MTRVLAAVVIATIATSGCAGRDDVRRLRADVRQLADSVNSLAAQPPTATATSVDGLAHKVTSVATQVAALEARTVETTVQLARLETRVAGAERVLQDLASRIDGLSTTVTKLEAAVARPSVAAAPPPAAVPPPRESAAGTGTPPQRAYASALAMFRSREHGQAVLDFLDFLARYPTHPLASSAQYWIAEAYYVQRDYKQALREFEKVLAYGSKIPKAADALLRAGMVAKQLQDGPRAEGYWRRVVEEHPGSDAAQRARGFLSGIGGSPAPR